MKFSKDSLKKFLKVLGPGFITGASDDDPSGIATYSQTGARFGYGQLWLASFSFPFQAVIQEICGRIGMVTGKGLAGVIRKNYAGRVLYIAVFLLLVANTINIGADLGAMASAGQLVLRLPFTILLLFMTVATLVLEVFVSYKVYAKFLKYLTFALLAYLVTAFIVKQDWGKIFQATFIPTFSFNKEYLMNIVAVLGTTISPYLFFWQAGEEVEEEVANKKLQQMGTGIPQITKRDIRTMRLDTVAGMFFSNLVMWFIIITAGSTLFTGNPVNIQTADQAALALKPLAGDFAFILFAIGIIGTGFLAVPILAGSASYAFSEAFGWKEGLYRKFTQAHGFYAVIIVATLIGLLVNFTPIKPFQMLYYTAIINGICAPPLMVLIMLIGNNQKIMGNYVNSFLSNLFGWTITVIMTLAALALLYTLIFS
ncbi:Nramp family divalent metal transporter [Candidatus Microgenomates bacterium]|nr:Nramp family divalent metal transporter [Candidatus Microgenomates bacterium]